MKINIFTQTVNREKDIEATLDGYQSVIKHQMYLAEALQKDAIQNSWDARLDKKNGNDWKCTFELLTIGKKRFLTITDEGTKGLIGTQFDDQEKLNEILLSKKKNENLAYFCNSNWSEKSRDEGGNRGRGKVVFLGASKNKIIYFDSFRSSDNRYVFVELYLDIDKEIKYTIYWDIAAKEKLAEVTNSEFNTLKKYGTRILILNPEDKISEAIKRGYLLSCINHTWWEIIKKFNAKILINDGFCKKIAETPMWYKDCVTDINVEDLSEMKFSFEQIFTDNNYKVENFILRFSPKRDIPVNLKGIAIQRGGMTIERIKTEGIVKEESVSKIYGWIEMNEELAGDMKNCCEGAEHFNFFWNRKPATYLNSYIRSKIRIFARHLKLIESEYAKKDKLQKTAAFNAVKALTPLFKKLNLSGKGVGPRIKIIAGRRPNEKLRLSAANFELPNENSRVNYGQSIKGAYVIPINEYNRDFNVLVRTWIESEDGDEQIIEEREFILRRGEGEKIGIENLNINEKLKKGEYSFKATMESMEETNFEILIKENKLKVEKGTILYRINKRFYIEKDPPETGPFGFTPRPSDNRAQLVDWELDGIILTIFYNTKHPQIQPLLNIDDKELTKYLIGQGVMLLYQIKIESLLGDGLIGNNFDNIDSELLSIVKSKNIDKIFPYLLERHSEIMWDYLQLYGDKNKAKGPGRQ